MPDDDRGPDEIQVGRVTYVRISDDEHYRASIFLAECSTYLPDQLTVSAKRIIRRTLVEGRPISVNFDELALCELAMRRFESRILSEPVPGYRPKTHVELLRKVNFRLFEDSEYQSNRPPGQSDQSVMGPRRELTLKFFRWLLKRTLLDEARRESKLLQVLVTHAMVKHEENLANDDSSQAARKDALKVTREIIDETIARFLALPELDEQSPDFHDARYAILNRIWRTDIPHGQTGPALVEIASEFGYEVNSLRTIQNRMMKSLQAILLEVFEEREGDLSDAFQGSYTRPSLDNENGKLALKGMLVACRAAIALSDDQPVPSETA
ncbi:MAG: hypothetical protein KDA53_00825 [Hyphomonas sp.]|nr:hypothetical protein [Hyphomonas sp.]